MAFIGTKLRDKGWSDKAAKEGRNFLIGRYKRGARDNTLLNEIENLFHRKKEFEKMVKKKIE